jgi:hypothetical protein
MNLAENIKSMRSENDKKIALFKESRKKRRYNFEREDSKITRLYYQSPINSLSQFSKHMEKLLDSSYDSYFQNLNKEISKTENLSKAESNLQEQGFNSSVDMSKDMIVPAGFNGFRVAGVEEVAFGFARDQFYQQSEQDQNVEVGCMVFGEDFKLNINFDKDSEKCDYLTYHKNLWDNNLKVNSE